MTFLQQSEPSTGGSFGASWRLHDRVIVWHNCCIDAAAQAKRSPLGFAVRQRYSTKLSISVNEAVVIVIFRRRRLLTSSRRTNLLCTISAKRSQSSAVWSRIWSKSIRHGRRQSVSRKRSVARRCRPQSCILIIVCAADLNQQNLIMARAGGGDSSTLPISTCSFGLPESPTRVCSFGSESSTASSPSAAAGHLVAERNAFEDVNLLDPKVCLPFA